MNGFVAYGRYPCLRVISTISLSGPGDPGLTKLFFFEPEEPVQRFPVGCVVDRYDKALCARWVMTLIGIHSGLESLHFVSRGRPFGATCASYVDISNEIHFLRSESGKLIHNSEPGPMPIPMRTDELWAMFHPNFELPKGHREKVLKSFRRRATEIQAMLDLAK